VITIVDSTELPKAGSSTLCIRGLRAGAGGREILRGIDLELKSGEVHAVMGPNGAGKSTLANVLMGHFGYEVLGGSVTLDGVELLDMPTWRRAQAGVFLAPQDPIEIPGVTIDTVLKEVALVSERTYAHGDDAMFTWLEREAAVLNISKEFLERGLNVDSSGGEKKRLEALQLLGVAPRFAILDELDSGLDIDALRDIAARIDRATKEPSASHDASGTGGPPLGVLVITHYPRLLQELRPVAVHVLIDGKIMRSGGPELADELGRSGYGAYSDSPQTDGPVLNAI
jgi:Fe-S cluster assembly ATP-binding protein